MEVLFLQPLTLLYGPRKVAPPFGIISNPMEREISKLDMRLVLFSPVPNGVCELTKSWNFKFNIITMMIRIIMIDIKINYKDLFFV